MIEAADRPKRTFVVRALRMVCFLVAAAIELPVVLLLYALIVASTLAFAIGLFDRIRAAHHLQPLWPDLYGWTGQIPGGLLVMPLVVLILAHAATKILDLLVDSLHPD